MVGPKVPAAQIAQIELPDKDAKLPDAQVLHAVAVEAEYIPASQTTHAESPVVEL